MDPSASNYVGPDAATVVALERTAADLARTAGAHICAAYEGELGVAFKAPAAGSAPNSNPVSRIDKHVEALIRTRLAAAWPEHTVIGEELPAAASSSPFTWVVDPIDGTTNFINGLPLFACSVGLLFRGHPIAGAIWCASTHTFHPGTYHARAGGSLQFDGRPLSRRAAGTWRGLAAEPGTAPTYAALWDTRVLGCATVEFAYVAAGLLRIAYIPQPRIWDAAAGLVLLHAADCRALAARASRWDTMLYFPSGTDNLVDWSEPLLIGSQSDLARARHTRA
ncbi:MAG: inositol monophosphatase family protein [Steroidobacteraceae bacterium]